MSPDDFVLALRALDAPVFLDDQGEVTPLGVEFAATTSDGKRVVVTQLSAALNGRVTRPDAFVRTLMAYGYQGAGITESGQLYFLELPARGVSLARRLATTGPVPAVELLAATRLLIDVLRGPGLHGMPHGMVTPSTVFLAADGAASVRWPGLTLALRAAGVDAPHIAQELAITPFVAPEVRQGGTFDNRADVFALGATLYTALTGRPPFGGRTTASVMAVVLADDGAPVTTAAGTLTTVLLRAIEEDPIDRWPDLQHFFDALGPDGGTPRATPQHRARTRSGCTSTAAALIIGILVLWMIGQYIS
jgi:hypothetical protein